MTAILLHAIADVPHRYAVTPRQLSRVCRMLGGRKLTFDDGYASIHPLLSAFDDQTARQTIVYLVAERIGAENDWDADGPLRGNPLMNWRQIRDLLQRGVAIGSHGCTHIDLTSCPNRILAEEIMGSKKILEDRLGVAVTTFAYPFGFFNQKVIDLVAQAGYTSAVTTSGSPWEGRNNPFRMRRIEITNADTRLAVCAKMTRLHDFIAIAQLPRLIIQKAILASGK